jgi:hypothetical protein
VDFKPVEMACGKNLEEFGEQTRKILGSYVQSLMCYSGSS